jgi:hypothetical protein
VSSKKPIKTGVRRGEGPPPGYQWSVDILESAFREAVAFLNRDQYQHLAMQVKDLATEDDPSHSLTCRVDQIEDFFELKDRGGILGKINVRVFFGLEHSQKRLVVLGCIKKETSGQTPTGDRVRMRRRWRKYRAGEFEIPE